MCMRVYVCVCVSLFVHVCACAHYIIKLNERTVLIITEMNNACDYNKTVLGGHWNLTSVHD